MGPGFNPINPIGLGSDFDGGTTMPFDTARIPRLLEGLASGKREGRRIFDDAAITQIAGENLLRIFAQTSDAEP